MKLEKALSIETEKKVTANKADILYEEGIIKSKFLFQCPDDNCDAQVTCANLTRPKRLRKRDPYFKVVSPHSHNCLIQKDIQNSLKKSRYKSNGFYGNEDEYLDNAVRLNLQPPSNKKPNQLRSTISDNNDHHCKLIKLIKLIKDTHKIEKLIKDTHKIEV